MPTAKRKTWRMRQEVLVFRTRGGPRPGAGRKPNGPRAGVSHARRPVLSGREPVLITLKVVEEIRSLRGARMRRAIEQQIERAAERLGMRVVEYSIQHDHIHLLVEPTHRAALSRAMQGLTVRLARAINRVMGRRGKVFADRYHARVLTSARQTRNALAYVLCNGRKHGHAPGPRWIDPCSSGPSFTGWSSGTHLPAARRTAAPRTWLLGVGWLRAGGPIPIGHCPGAQP